MLVFCEKEVDELKLLPPQPPFQPPLFQPPPHVGQADAMPPSDKRPIVAVVVPAAIPASDIFLIVAPPRLLGSTDLSLIIKCAHSEHTRTF